MDGSRLTILLDEPKEVDVVTIEKELSQLWKTAGEPADGESTAPVIRACSLNFVVVTDDRSGVNSVEEMVGEVTLVHPSRIFLVTLDRSLGTPSLEAWVSARCSLPVAGGKQVCCEEITLNARGTDIHKIPSIITSLVVPDVPVALLWKAKVDAADPVLKALAHISDRLMIDSSEEMAPLPVLIAWSSFITRGNYHCSFGDLAWSHTDEWRSRIAESFQPAEFRSHLSSIENVSIRYSSTTVPLHSGLSQSMLLAGWFADRLRWTPVRPFTMTGDFAAKLRAGDQAVTLHIVKTQPQEVSPGGIESVSVKCRGGLEVALNATTNRNCIQQLVLMEREVRHEKMSLIRDRSEAELMIRELEEFQRNIIYEGSLYSLTTMLGEPDGKASH